MSPFRLPSYTKFSLGYRFDQQKEVVALGVSQYFYLVFFSIIVVLLHVEGNLYPITFRYHALILMGLLSLGFLRVGWVGLTRVITLSIPPFLLLLLPPMGG